MLSYALPAAIALAPALVMSSDDGPGHELSQARVRYEKEMDSVREDMSNLLRQGRVGSSVEECREWLRRFEVEGRWPDTENRQVKKIMGAHRSLSEKLSGAYRKSVEHCFKSQHPLEDVIAAEMEQWQHVLDTVAWTSEDPGGEARQEWILPIPELPRAYRLHVRGSVTDAESRLKILLPMPEGRRFPFEVEVDNGSFEFWATVGPDGIPAADAGLVRIPRYADVERIAGDGAELQVDSGAIAVERLRWKPVATNDDALAVESSSSKPNPLAAWVAGSRWTQTNGSKSGDVTWTVRSRDDERLVLTRPSGKLKRGVLVFALEIEGESVEVTQLIYETPIKVLTRNVGGDGRIGAKSLRFDFSSEILNPSGKNKWRDFGGDVVLAPSKE